ncbi:hypothetical protein BJX70DRAFT_394731 [Aspergillus crustosus]
MDIRLHLCREPSVFTNEDEVKGHVILTTSSEYLSLPSTCSVRAKLLNGPYILLGQPLSLAIDILDLNQRSADISLHDFQSMLLEKTEIRARSSKDTFTRSWVIQTIANLRQPLVISHSHNTTDRRAGPVLSVDDSLWKRHHIPLFLTPTFETCNISRSYKLAIRLGVGFGGNNTRIVEFQFAVHVVSLPLGEEFREDGNGDVYEEQDDVPAPAYYETEELEKELLV